jgi:uncharacterized tellurite resistance protein B-like protein
MLRPVFHGFLLALIACAGSLVAAPANAAKFGTREKLHVIAPTQLTMEGKPLSICYKAETYFFIAGVYTTDEYVMCEGGASKRYWPMPAGQQLADLQNAGLLPSPLPPYSRDAIDYAFGYSLWIILALIPIWLIFDHFRSKAEAPKKLAQIKLTARRVMAWAASSATNPDASTGVAREIYRQLFDEPLAKADFAADMAWVRSEPAAYDGFLGAMGRKLDGKAKAILLHAAARVAMANGAMDAAGEGAIRHLAQKLGIKPEDTDAFLVSLRQPPGGTQTQPSLDGGLGDYRPDMRVEIKASWPKTLGLLLIGLVFTVGGVFIVTRPFHPPPGSWEEYFGFSFGYLIIAFFGACTLVFLRYAMWLGKPVVVITSEGVADLRSKKQLLPWSAVSGIGWWGIQSAQWLVLGIDPNAEAALSERERKELARNQRRGINGLAINATMLAIGKRKLIEICDNALRNSRVANRNSRPGAPKTGPGAAPGKPNKMASATVILADDQFASAIKVTEAIRRRFPEFAPEGGEDAGHAGAMLDVSAGKFSTSMFVGAPNPLGDNESFVASAWWWPDVKARLAERKAHVSLFVSLDGDAKDSYLKLVAMTAGVVECHPSAIGVIWDAADAIWPAPAYLSAVNRAAGTLPVEMLVSVKLNKDTHYPNKDGSPALLCMTYGLAAFGVMEVEVRAFPGTPAELGAMALSMASYLLNTGAVIKNGDTIGREGEPQFRVTYELSTLDIGKQVYRLHIDKPANADA